MVNIISNYAKTAITIILLFHSVSTQAKLTASVNRTDLSSNETLELIIKHDDINLLSAPDFSSLNDDFEVIGTRQNNQISIINGVNNSITIWRITLLPKHAGTLTIPVIRLENQATQPIKITVTNNPSSSDDQLDNNKNVIIETVVDQSDVFVQSQILYTVKLYRSTDVYQGSLTDPVAKDAIVQRIGDQQHYDKIINNIHYIITERQYAIFPQKSGELAISEIVFSGYVADAYSQYRSIYSPTDGKLTRIKSDGHKINIKPSPNHYPNTTWLPAKQLTISEDWSDDIDSFTTGNTITRKITITANGLLASQLPSIQLDAINDIKIYSDQPQTSNAETLDGIVGSRTETFALVPTQAGKLELPEITITWWNTLTNTVERSTIPTRKINILAGNNKSNKIITTTEKPTHIEHSKNSKVPSSIPWIWIIVAIVFGFAWILTIILWLVTKKKKNTEKPISNQSSQTQVSEKNTFIALLKSLDNNNLTEIRNMLVTWAEQYWPQSNITSLYEFNKHAKQYLTPELAKQLSFEIEQLESALYQDKSSQWNSSALKNIIVILKNSSSNTIRSKLEELPPLYPK